ncbi:ABC transporter permease [Bacteroides sp. 214]|uniref:ABC transporter permease n=1 Tax=Bacteroides sp. 214 TaxID=2302935 RepID=UPI0013D59FE9|nr:ABC transporter permease [Bacteroides sp. 214]NDW12418.1 ABC transporter permease [Bacteroides sp. 214]
MLMLYLKQAWQLLKQNKLYSSVYILGTGMAIAVVMTIAIIYYIKIAPVYPEVNRNRTLVGKNMMIKYTKSGAMSSSLYSWNFVKEHLYTLKSAEAVSAVLSVWDDYPLVRLPNEKGMLPVTVAYTDHHYWQVFGFEFLHGKPFSEADFESGIKTTVITKSLANILFGTVEAEGKYVELDGNDYRVSGVVRDVSFAAKETYAQLWVPFTVKPEAIANTGKSEGTALLGALKVFILAPTASATAAVAAEAEGIIKQINAAQEKYVADMSGQPEAYWKSVFRQSNNNRIDWAEIIQSLGFILLALLIIPAVNLAGMVSSRMEKRLAEMGVRKSFGASRGVLLWQVLVENLLLTTLGGLLGLVLSFVIMYCGRSWILGVFDRWQEVPPEGISSFFDAGMFFNPVVFFIALAVCFVLNLLSAIIPAYNGLRKNIVVSLNHNK